MGKHCPTGRYSSRRQISASSFPSLPREPAKDSISWTITGKILMASQPSQGAEVPQLSPLLLTHTTADGWPLCSCTSLVPSTWLYSPGWKTCRESSYSRGTGLPAAGCWRYAFLQSNKPVFSLLRTKSFPQVSQSSNKDFFPEKITKKLQCVFSSCCWLCHVQLHYHCSTTSAWVALFL